MIVNFEVIPSLSSTIDTNILILKISKSDVLLSSETLTASLLKYRLILELNNKEFNYDYEI